MENENTDNIIISRNRVYLDSMTIRQKLAQMIIVRGDFDRNMGFLNYNIGGIYLAKQDSKSNYSIKIKNYQSKTRINLFVSTDMEGAANPFKKFRRFPNFSEINNPEEAYLLGLEHGFFLKEMGFNINFAPVSEFNDSCYGGRAFLGSPDEVKKKISNYILGLQTNIKGTCKHYPGKGMIKNLHDKKDKQEIDYNDLELFRECIESNISAIMIGHQVVTGAIESNGKSSSVSEEVISTLNDFEGLIISDEINMDGISEYYRFKKPEMYKDLINSGEDIILDFSLTKRSCFLLLNELEEKVKTGEIDEEKIDKSVKKILKAKGYEVI